MIPKNLSNPFMPRLPVELAWPWPIWTYLRRSKLFIYSGMVPLLFVGALPLPGVPTGLILRIAVMTAGILVAIELIQHRIVGTWRNDRLREVRNARGEVLQLLRLLIDLPEAHRQPDYRELFDEGVKLGVQLDALEDALAAGEKYSLASDLGLVRSRLSALAEALSSTATGSASIPIG